MTPGQDAFGQHTATGWDTGMIDQLSKGFINPGWFNWLDSDKLGSPLMINKPTDWRIQVDIDNWMVQ